MLTGGCARPSVGASAPRASLAFNSARGGTADGLSVSSRGLGDSFLADKIDGHYRRRKAAANDSKPHYYVRAAADTTELAVFLYWVEGSGSGSGPLGRGNSSWVFGHKLNDPSDFVARTTAITEAGSKKSAVPVLGNGQTLCCARGQACKDLPSDGVDVHKLYTERAF